MGLGELVECIERMLKSHVFKYNGRAHSQLLVNVPVYLDRVVSPEKGLLFKPCSKHRNLSN